MNYLTRISIFNTVVALAAGGSIYFFNAFNLLLLIDPTRVSLLIFAIYIAITAYLAWKGERANFKAVNFIGTRLTSIGLVGTVIGIMMLLSSIGGQNFSELSQAVTPMFTGFSTVLITTLAGIGTTLLTNFQLAYVFKRWEDE